jgi:hypothetical protein
MASDAVMRLGVVQGRGPVQRRHTFLRDEGGVDRFLGVTAVDAGAGVPRRLRRAPDRRAALIWTSSFGSAAAEGGEHPEGDKLTVTRTQPRPGVHISPNAKRRLGEAGFR